MLAGARRAALLLVAGAMAAVAGSAWLGIVRSAASPAAEAFATARHWQPFGGPAVADAADRTLPALPAVDQRAWVLRQLGRLYPLSAALWLQRARLALDRHPGGKRVPAYLAVATAIQPGDADLQWTAAMLALRSGALDAAMDHLHEFVTLRPVAVAQAVLVARRWLGDPARLLATLVPDNKAALVDLLPNAAHWGDWPLAAAIWQRLPAAVRAENDVIAPYVNQLILAGRGPVAAQVWRVAEPGFAIGTVFNGDFSRALQHRSLFDWQTQTPDGAAIARDEQVYASAPASLRVTFAGTHNLRLSNPTQFIAVQPGGQYRLRGRWHGVGVTTRARPSWVVSSVGAEPGKRLASVAVPVANDWPWQTFTVPFTVPESVHVVSLQLRRSPTDRFDRFIAGQLYLDDIELLTAAQAERTPAHD